MLWQNYISEIQHGYYFYEIQTEILSGKKEDQSACIKEEAAELAS